MSFRPVSPAPGIILNLSPQELKLCVILKISIFTNSSTMRRRNPFSKPKSPRPSTPILPSPQSFSRQFLMELSSKTRRQTPTTDGVSRLNLPSQPPTARRLPPRHSNTSRTSLKKFLSSNSSKTLSSTTYCLEILLSKLNAISRESSAKYTTSPHGPATSIPTTPSFRKPTLNASDSEPSDQKTHLSYAISVNTLRFHPSMEFLNGITPSNRSASTGK